MRSCFVLFEDTGPFPVILEIRTLRQQLLALFCVLVKVAKLTVLLKSEECDWGCNERMAEHLLGNKISMENHGVIEEHENLCSRRRMPDPNIPGCCPPLPLSIGAEAEGLQYDCR